MPLHTLALPANSTFAATLIRIWARIRTSQFWMVAIAFILRVGWIIVAHTYKFKSTENNFSFGWEMGRIGAAIVSGQGFSNPFGAQTGPTAWVSPLYPYLIGGVFRILLPCIGVRVADNQQYFFRSYLHSDFSHRAPNLFRKSCRWLRMDMGLVALRDVLVHALGVGDKFLRASADEPFLADAHHGRSCRPETMAGIWAALGTGRAGEHGSGGVFTRFGIMGVVSAREKVQAIA